MKATMRRYQHAEDYWRIREFLREIHLINNRLQNSWEVARFDYWRWHGILNMKDGTLETDVFIWETPDGRIDAVLNREAPGSVWIQVRPESRTESLEKEMLSVAEEHLTVRTKRNTHHLHVWCLEENLLRQEILKRCGYAPSEKRKTEYQRTCDLTREILPVPLAEGYTIRPLGDVDEHNARSWLSWRAFHPDEPDENHQGHDWYANIQRAPLYRRDLDLIVVAPDGTHAAFCTIWFDDVTRTGLFEPVGTSPEHQRKGLGKALMTEGLRRLKHAGADLAYVGSFTPPAHALYASVGFTDYRLLIPWDKEL